MCSQAERAEGPAARWAAVSRGHVGTGSWDTNPGIQKQNAEALGQERHPKYTHPFLKEDEQSVCKQLTEGCVARGKQANNSFAVLL